MMPAMEQTIYVGDGEWDRRRAKFYAGALSELGTAYAEDASIGCLTSSLLMC